MAVISESRPPHDAVGACASPWGRGLRVLLVALSLSIGWGVRGNFGHEIGAMFPGALAAAAAVIVSGRADWHRRVAFFAAAGALGWSAGGSMSYMQVIGYTHSGHSASQLYGFASLFLLGFLWAAPGGAATALPAFLSRPALTAFFAPLAAVAAVWTATSLGVACWDRVDADFRQDSPLYWYDTNWLDALGVIVAVLGLAAIRRRWDFASSLLLHAAVGWWIAFLVLVPGLGLRMTPPRGDNWAGAVGLAGGMAVFFWRRGLPGVNEAGLVSGLFGGAGFAGAAMIKMAWMATGLSTNWHSVLEQTYGFINGLGVAAAMFRLNRSAPTVSDEPPVRPWADSWAFGFAVLGVSYLNLRQNPAAWIQAKVVAPALYGIPTALWHEAAWALLGLAFFAGAAAQRRGSLALAPASWLGVAQGLYLSLLWIMVAGNFMRELPGFAPQRLITEGVIHLNAILCTLGVLCLAPTGSTAPVAEGAGRPARLRRALAVGAAAWAAVAVACWGGARVLYGDRVAGGGKAQIRFGPDATATTAKPERGRPHP